MVFRQLIENGILPGETGKYATGDCLFRAGESVTDFHFIMTGSVCLTPAVATPIPSVASQHNLLGLPDLMNETFSHTATVLEDSVLVRIRRKDLLKALQRDPHLRLYLLRKMSRQTSLMKAAYE